MRVEKLIPFLIKNKLTTSQYYLLYCVHNNLTDTIKLYKAHFPPDDENDKTMIGKSLIDDLFSRKLLIREKVRDKMENNTKIPVYKYSVSKEFLEMYLNQNTAFTEILKTYPNKVNIGVTEEKYIFSKNVNVPELTEIYYNKINKCNAEHNEIIDDIKFANKYNLLNFDLNTFILEEKWEIFRNLRNQQALNKEISNIENVVFSSDIE